MKVSVFAFSSLLIIALLLGGCGTNTTTYSLFLHVQGEGSVLPAAGTYTYQEGTAIELAAEPKPGWLFSHWEGRVAEKHAAHTSIVADQDQVVRAIFVKDSAPPIKTAPGGLITYRNDGSTVKSRPRGTADIEYIMIHAISDAAANPTNPYRLERIRRIFQDYSVEAHYLIDRGGNIYQYVQDQQTARHAGIGSWNYDPRLTNNMNRYAIGIELMGIGTAAEMAGVIGQAANNRVRDADRGYTNSQYISLQQLTNHLKELYNIPTRNIIGHDAYDPGRKWDPGDLFDWSIFE